MESFFPGIGGVFDAALSVRRGQIQAMERRNASRGGLAYFGTRHAAIRYRHAE